MKAERDSQRTPQETWPEGKRLRILIVTDHYPPFIGGAHRQSYFLAQNLHAMGHRVGVASVWHVGLPGSESDNGVEVYRFKQIATAVPGVTDPRQRHHPPFPDPVTTLGLRHLINTFKPDVVHSHGWISYSAALALMGKKIPLLISARDYGYSCATRTLLYKDQLCSGPELDKCLHCASDFYGVPKGPTAVLGVALGRLLLRHKVSGIHDISNFVKLITERALVGGQDRAAKIPEVVIPSFLVTNDDSLNLSSEKLARLPKEPFILFVGAFQRRKGLYQLLEAYKRLPMPPPLVLIGTIERDSPTDIPQGVIMLEDFPHSCVMAAWERCMFGVVPSLWPEPLGAVVFEAMSKGKAVIGTTPGGHTDMIVDGETGYLVPPGDVNSLSDAMCNLIENPKLLEQFGKAAKERMKLFTADIALPRFEALYQQLVAR